MGVYYIGIFPPKYGGVTIKNKNLYQVLSEQINVKKIDLNKIKRFDLVEAVKLCIVLLNRENKLIIGIAGQRRLFSKVLYYLNRKCMKKSVIFVMGGLAAKEIADDSKYTKYMKSYKKIFVETKGMQKELEQVGFANVEIYPNARYRPQKKMEPQKNNNNPIKCVFFSFIDETKGADIVLESAVKTTNIEFHFYGEIGEVFKKCFFDSIAMCDNIYYHGVFKGTDNEVYEELRKYDVLLLPTKWKAEGIPGILVESKIACIPAIVSDVNYNKEIVINGTDGIVLKKNNSNHLSQAIEKLNEKSELLLQMRSECKKESEQYYIDTYLDLILNSLESIS